VTGEFYGKTFYACFINGDGRAEEYPFSFINQYQLVESGVVEPFLYGKRELYAGVKTENTAGRDVFERVFREFQENGLESETFRRDKLSYLGSRMPYNAAVSFEMQREAGKFGEYGGWYKLTFTEEGSYVCDVEIYSEAEEEFLTESYFCGIERLSGNMIRLLRELYRIYPDGERIMRETGLTGFRGMQVDKIRICHCDKPYYLCVELLGRQDSHLGFFDMGRHDLLLNSCTDKSAFNPSSNIIFLSHYHGDHVSGLEFIVMLHQSGTVAFHNFFKKAELYVPNTIRTLGLPTVVKTITDEGGRCTLYNKDNSFPAEDPDFDLGMICFNHPQTGKYDTHPHLHGLYVTLKTTGGSRMLLAGDTVYRGMSNEDREAGTGALAGPYDVLVSCHHGGDYAVSCAKSYLPQGVSSQDYIPNAAEGALVIHSANGNGISGSHPHKDRIKEYVNRQWSNQLITNGNYTVTGTIPENVTIKGLLGYVEVT